MILILWRIIPITDLKILFKEVGVVFNRIKFALYNIALNIYQTFYDLIDVVWETEKECEKDVYYRDDIFSSSVFDGELKEFIKNMVAAAVSLIYIGLIIKLAGNIFMGLMGKGHIEGFKELVTNYMKKI